MKNLLCCLLILGSFSVFANPNHQCIAIDSGKSCDLEVLQVCPSGFKDGCLTGETETHQCVAIDSGRSCDLEVLQVCPESFEDVCLNL